MRRIMAVGGVVVAVLMLTACSRPPQGRATVRTGAGATSDQRISISSAADVEKASVTTALRVFDDGGKVGLCGAVIIVGQDASVATLRQRLLAPEARLLIGDRLALSPGFMAYSFYPASQMAGQKVELPLGSIPDKCTRIDQAWDSQLARTSFKLSFLK